MPINLVRFEDGQRELLVIGGPYRDRIGGTYGVKLAPEVPGDFDVIVPIRDFGVPTMDQYETGLISTINAALDGHVVYVGCGAGQGRTGLFIAGIRRVLSHDNGPEAIAWTRRHYNRHAVETNAQESMLCDLDVGYVRSVVYGNDFVPYIAREQTNAVIRFMRMFTPRPPARRLNGHVNSRST